MAPAALAKAGNLDQSFGRNGKVTRAANFGGRPWDSVSTKLAKLPGGGVVILASRTLYGFAADGSISSTFGNVKVADPKGGTLQLADVAVDSRGRVLIAGGSRATSGANESPEYAFVARYTRRGKLDPSFGNKGAVITDFGLPGPRVAAGESAPASRVAVVGIAVDPSDRVILTGTRLRSIGPCRGTSNLSYHEAYVARLDSNGHPDSAFGDAGVVSLAAAPGVTRGVQSLNPPVVDADGKVYLSTQLGPCEEGESPLVGRLDSSGRTDPSFGTAGWAQVSGGISETGSGFTPVQISLDHRGRLLLVGQHGEIAIVKRMLPSGALDQGFGSRGVAKMSGPGGRQLSLAGEAVDESGRVLIAATVGRSFFVGRLTSKGQIDASFGRSGRLSTSFGSRARAAASSVTIDARGRAVVAGTVASSRLPGGDGLALARYLLGN